MAHYTPTAFVKEDICKLQEHCFSQFCEDGFWLNELPLRCLHAAVHAKFSILAHLALKGAINGQGFYQKCQPDGQKGVISEKEIAIFELRKVLFLDKHLRELPGA